MSDQHTLHFIMQAVHETLHLFGLSVHIIRCIPGELSELVQIGRASCRERVLRLV